MNTVLVVDDKELLRDSVGATLQRANFNVMTAPDAPTALEIIARRRPDVVVTDLKMPGGGGDGLSLLEQAGAIDDCLPVILMTAFGAVDTAVKAMKLGAFDYITKPFEGDELIVAVKRAIEHSRVLRENAVLRTFGEVRTGPSENAGPPTVTGLDRIVGDSAAMRRVKQQVLAVADSHGTVLICGESGTGKEVVARAIHELSQRKDEAFLAVNCAALSDSLLESELFGHERGSFTGAERLRKGRFELADRGTLVLDEISEVSSSVQAKLLRVLQERAFERVGSSMTIGVDVRIIATSNRDLPRSVSRGDFRQDLFFRLNVLPIHIPPLHDRLEDVPALVTHFMAITARREGKPVKRFSDDALSVLRSYTWPGNVREVQNICERASVLCKADVIDRQLIEPWLFAPEHTQPAGIAAAVLSSTRLSLTEHKPGALNGSSLGAPSMLNGSDPDLVAIQGRALEDIERDAIVRTLTHYNGHRQRTAQSLGIGVRTLGLKLKKWKQLQLVDSNL